MPVISEKCAYKREELLFWLIETAYIIIRQNDSIHITRILANNQRLAPFVPNICPLFAWKARVSTFSVAASTSSYYPRVMYITSGRCLCKGRVSPESDRSPETVLRCRDATLPGPSKHVHTRPALSPAPLVAKNPARLPAKNPAWLLGRAMLTSTGSS